MYLDQPLFKLKQDKESKFYATVSNRLEVTRKGVTHFRAVQVPASLFHLMRYFNVPRGQDVTLYLDIDRDRAIFGFCLESGLFWDLWPYNVKALPAFVL